MTDDTIIIERLGEFVQAARSLDPNLMFTAQEVVQWAKLMYTDDIRGMDNTNKISYLVSYNAGYLGLEEIKAGSRKSFKVIT